MARANQGWLAALLVILLLGAAPVRGADTNEPPESAQITERLREKNLQEIKRPQVEKLFAASKKNSNGIVFIDARDEGNFSDGHIPGALELNPYYPEKRLDAVLPVCKAAQKIIVYCTGGDCDDSDTAAILLREAGVPSKNIFVYGGGFTEWKEAKLPVEIRTSVPTPPAQK